MTRTPNVRPSDLRGLTRLATAAIAGVTDLIEETHHAIARPARWLAPPVQGSTQGVTALVYRHIRDVTHLVGSGIDAILAQFVALAGEGSSSRGREAMIAVLNGVWGDYLAAGDNPLAIPMSVRREGQPLILERQALRAAIAQPSSKLVVLLHGLCMNDLQWTREGHDHGVALARELGYTPVYFHYNSGLHTSTNGRSFASLLEALLAQWPQPVEGLSILAHSMGGLVARSAWHYGTVAGHAWPRHLAKIIFLGTPHHGAPLERVGNWVDTVMGVTPYMAPFARLGKLRSAGITDLRYGNLLDEDWEGCDRFKYATDTRRCVPLPDGVQSYAIAATTGQKQGGLKDLLVGDGLVPVSSALGHHAQSERCLSFPESRQWIGYEMNHLDLLGRPEVYTQIKQWLV